MSETTPPVLEIHSGITLKGNLSMVKDVVLTGKFEGDIQTQGCLTVMSGAVIKGSIVAGALVLEPGYHFEGRVKVAPPPKAATRAPEENEKKPAENLWSGGIRKLKEFALGRT